VVVIVMNFILKITEEKEHPNPAYKPALQSSSQQPEEQPVSHETIRQPEPEYEATVSNGTILF